MPPNALEDVRERMRAHRRELDRQWAEAHADMERRASAMIAALPGLLRTPIPAFMRDWPRPLMIGIMLRYVHDRYWRVHNAMGELLPWDEELDALFQRVEAGEAEPEALRRLVFDIRGRVAAANDAARAGIPADAEAVANYVGGHMRMRFRPHGRTRLIALAAEHLTALMDHPMPQTLDAERRVGELELGCADEFEAARNAAIRMR